MRILKKFIARIVRRCLFVHVTEFEKYFVIQASFLNVLIIYEVRAKDDMPPEPFPHISGFYGTNRTGQPKSDQPRNGRTNS